MHILILGRRRSAAQNKISTIAQALAEKFELDPALIKALKVQEKNVAVRALKEQEAIANLLAEVAVALGIKLNSDAGVTVETDAEAISNPDDGEGADADDGEGLG